MIKFSELPRSIKQGSVKTGYSRTGPLLQVSVATLYTSVLVEQSSEK